MPLITADVTSDYATILTVQDNDTYFIAGGVLVSSTSPAIPAYPAIYVVNTNIQVSIAGTVASLLTSALYSYGLNTLVAVSASGSMVTLGQGWDCVIFAASGGRVINDGSIAGTVGAVTSYTGDAGVFNTGLITGVTTGVSGAALVENLGTIRGAIAVAMGDGHDRLINMGTLVGKVTLGLGDDLFDTIGGHVTGTVAGGGGEDVYRTDTALLAIIEDPGEGMGDRVESTVDFDLGTVDEVEDLTLLGGAVRGIGNGAGNVLTGTIGDNVLGGAAGNDTVNGGFGDDSLRGGSGNDLINSDADDDLARGGLGADRVYGGDGDDVLYGDGGSDKLNGEDGEDVLQGGGGRDTLSGGADADRFVFQFAADSGFGAAVRDQILGFEVGLDVIDLRGMDAKAALSGNQAFVWIGTAAFGSVAGQLRVVAGVNSVVQGDVNGDGVPDFEMQLTGVAMVGVNDILL